MARLPYFLAVVTAWVLVGCATVQTHPQKDDFRWVRGANYVPSYAATSVMTWRDFDAEVIDRELGFAEQFGINSVRTFLQYHVYEQERERFLANVENFVGLCAKHHIRPMLTLFDSCMGVSPSMNSEEFWVAGPGPHRTNPAFYPDGEQYVKDLADRFGNDKRILMWDVMNEPMVSLDLPIAEAKQQIWDFVRHFADYLKACGVTQPITSGVIGLDSSEIAAHIDVLSVHEYSTKQEDLQKNIAATRQTAQALGKPFIVTECGAPGWGANYEWVLPTLREEGVGSYFWELMIGKTMFRHISGMVYPDGTVRSRSSVEAVAGKELPQFRQKPESEGVSFTNDLTWPKLFEMSFTRMQTRPTDDENWPERYTAMLMGLHPLIKMITVDTETLGTQFAKADEAMKEGRKDEAYRLMDALIPMAREALTRQLDEK